MPRRRCPSVPAQYSGDCGSEPGLNIGEDSQEHRTKLVIEVIAFFNVIGISYFLTLPSGITALLLPLA
jgi:hypothetical protein